MATSLRVLCAYALICVGVIAAASIASATITCPCIRPGESGVIVKIKALNGTMEGVSFYKEGDPVIGTDFIFWALKEKESSTHQIDFFPVEGLKTSIYLGSRKLEEAYTDENGAIEMKINAPGRYKVFAGDASLVFDIKGTQGDPVKAVLEKSRFLGFIYKLASVVGKVPPISPA